MSAESTVFRETPESVAAQIAQGGAAILMRGVTAIGEGGWVGLPGPGGLGALIEVQWIGVLPEFKNQGL
ncbi:MAG: hypothetical protein Q8S09_16485, partial [Hyphomonas sp.]|nr:hypothetical protein [Hyphomonas sp.]